MKQTNTNYKIGIIQAMLIFIRTILRKCRNNYIGSAFKINFQQKLENRKKEILLVSSGPFELVTNCTSIWLFLLFQSFHARKNVSELLLFNPCMCWHQNFFAWHMPIQFFLYKYRILQIKWLTWPIDFMQKKAAILCLIVA